MIASPMFSLYRLIPGPLVAVITRLPAMAAPMQNPIDAISFFCLDSNPANPR
jgi:hypothetical protein